MQRLNAIDQVVWNVMISELNLSSTEIAALHGISATTYQRIRTELRYKFKLFLIEQDYDTQ